MKWEIYKSSLKNLKYTYHLITNIQKHTYKRLLVNIFQVPITSWPHTEMNVTGCHEKGNL